MQQAQIPTDVSHLPVVGEDALVVAPAENDQLARLFQGDAYERCTALATMMATGKTTVPAHLRGSVGDCMAVVTQAMQWGMNPFAVAQKTHIVNGALGYESQLIIAAVNSSGLLQGRLEFDWEGPWENVIGKKGGGKEDGCAVTVYGLIKGEAKARSLTIEMAQASVRNSPLWATDPKQQLAYLAAKRWARLYAPDVVLGVYSADELAEFRPQERDITPRATPAQIGAAARPEINESDERDALIASLELTKLRDGSKALAEHWSTKLSKEQRKMVGPEEIERIKGLHAATDTAATAAKPVKAPPPADVVPAEAAAAKKPGLSENVVQDFLVAISEADDADALATIIESAKTKARAVSDGVAYEQFMAAAAKREEQLKA